MFIQDYIKERYPIQLRIDEMRKDPYAMIAARDDLPYDDIMRIDDVLQKVMLLENGEPIPIMTLLSYCEEDAKKELSPEIYKAYEVYMSNVDTKDVELVGMIDALQAKVKAERDRKKEAMAQCTK